MIDILAYDPGFWIKIFLKIGISLWNKTMTSVYELLATPPNRFEGGNAWGFIQTINPAFVTVATTLLVLFFLWGLCSESMVTTREDFNVWTVVKLFLRLIVAEYIVTHSLVIITYLFQIGSGFVNIVGQSEYTKMKISDDMFEGINELGFVGGVIMTPVFLIVALIMIICSLMILFAVYFRFIKLYALVPFSSVVFATIGMGGNNQISSMGQTYFKYFLSVVLEVVTMAIAIAICNALTKDSTQAIAVIQSLTNTVSGVGKSFTELLACVIQLLFTMSLTVGSVKGAQVITQKALGL